MDLPSKLLTLKPNMRLLRTALSNILPRASITKTNNNGDNESPCLKPLVLPKKPQGEPLIKMEKWTVDRQKRIHCLHLAENPLLSNICNRKFQFTWYYFIGKLPTLQLIISDKAIRLCTFPIGTTSLFPTLTFKPIKA